MYAGRPRKIRMNKRARNKVFGRTVRGAMTPNQIMASVGRNRVRPRKR